jgi:arylsulfatase A-like enzyme/Flp pilus assembly protein TadD
MLVLAAGAWAGYRFLPGARPSQRGPHDKLNVLLVTLDTTRADYLGCYGRPGAQTPNIDRLAAEGARFERCRTCAPLTLASHASILTGVYPYVHGARRNGLGHLADGNLTLAEALKEQGYATQATVASFVLDSQFGTAQGFDVYHDVTVRGAGDSLHAERRGDQVADDAVAMLRTLAAGPFLLWVHFYDPHYPYESPRGLPQDSPQAYADEIAFMDVQIGRLLGELKHLNLDASTLVVLVADHGEGLGQHGEPLHGTFLYETTARTALVLRCPGTIPAGQTIAAQVRTIDLAPTILDFVGAPAWNHAQGASLRPLLLGQPDPADRAAYCESFEGNALFGLSPLRSLTADGWKYVLAPRPELYDLESDPEELRNRAGHEPERAANLRERLRTLIAEAPPPPADVGRVSLSSSDLAKLRTLGYVGSSSSAETSGATELDRFEPRGGDPKDFARWFEVHAHMEGVMRDGDYAKAEQLLRELIEVLPDVPGLRVDLGNALNKQGRLAEANEAFGRAVSLAPADMYVRKSYAYFLLYSARQFEAAAKQLSVALEKQPDDVGALHDLAVSLISLGQLERAEGCLQRALALEPRTVRLLQAMGVLRMQQKRLPEAAEYFRKVLEIDPSSAEARAALQQVQRQLGP